MTTSSTKLPPPAGPRQVRSAAGLMLDLAALNRGTRHEADVWQVSLGRLMAAVTCDAAILQAYGEGKKLSVIAAVDGLIRSEAVDPVEVGNQERRRRELIRDRIESMPSVYSAPLLTAETEIAVLSLGRQNGEPFGDAEKELASAAADLLAMSMQIRRYRERVTILNDRIADGMARGKGADRCAKAAEYLGAAADLAASVNHKINNPLAVIVGHIQCLLIGNQISDEKILSRLRIIEKAALAISDINKKLTTITRLAREIDTPR